MWLYQTNQMLRLEAITNVTWSAFRLLDQCTNLHFPRMTMANASDTSPFKALLLRVVSLHMRINCFSFLCYRMSRTVFFSLSGLFYGGAVVVWWSDLYQKETLWQLSDTAFYAKVEKDLTPAQIKNLSKTPSRTL